MTTEPTGSVSSLIMMYAWPATTRAEPTTPVTSLPSLPIAVTVFPINPLESSVLWNRAYLEFAAGQRERPPSLVPNWPR